MDLLFGNEFMNLTSVSEVEDRGTLKVIDLSTPTMQHESSTVLPLQASSPCSINDSSLSGELVDTDVLSSNESTSSRTSWPAVFHVPKFSYDAELKLQQAGLVYIQNGTVLIPDPKLKSAILDGLVQEIVQYKVYVSDKEMEQVAQSLIKKHPCLTEKGSSTGYGGWKMSLKYKLSNYRTQLRKLGCPEVTVNSLKNKPVGKRSAAFGIKKAKTAEVNFCPTYPSAETEESLEEMRKALLLDVKKRNNREAVKFKMEKTFAFRRHEVVRDAPMVDDFMARWPALFEVSEVRLISCCFFCFLDWLLKGLSCVYWQIAIIPNSTSCVCASSPSFTVCSVMVTFSLSPLCFFRSTLNSRESPLFHFSPSSCLN